ncbi:hypothetical protein P5673_025364 [Acropora cervicornis]|uniref:Uncharacterized protein n=1 Tax=Acropora cervicornis TaxID=6130 RepID=A0AAD9Q2X5_ACRCE|nr:hypothetical protein P5673_025364 [Acropora cervicornis]
MLSACLLFSATFLTVTSAASISSAEEYCVHEGEQVKPGNKVVVENCQYICRCLVSQGYAHFMCEPLCETYYDSVCENGEEPVMELEDSSVPQCKCRRYYCPERQPVAHFIDFGTDGGYFEPHWEPEIEEINLAPH